MFSLIISIFSIALVAALSLATIYYGGSAFNNSQSKSKAAQVVLQGQQIAASIEIYRSQHGGAIPADMSALIANKEYLSTAPNSAWTFVADYLVYPMADTDACKKANAAININLTTIPLCSAVAGKTLCCQVD